VTGRPAAPRDWDAASYDRVSAPQAEWAAAVLDRLPLAGDETVLDAGCGSGRVTRLLAERLPHGRVIAVDGAPSMVALTREAFADDERVEVLDAVDLVELELEGSVDAVFSNAVFHWVPDHRRLFARLHALLRPGGRLAAQCGGQGNIDRFDEAAREVARREPYAEHFADWRSPWNFRGAEETRRSLREAGFEQVGCDVEQRRVTSGQPLEFVTTVCLGHHLEVLPGGLRERFARAVVEACGAPLVLDYRRLNIAATRPSRA